VALPSPDEPPQWFTAMVTPALTGKHPLVLRCCQRSSVYMSVVPDATRRGEDDATVLLRLLAARLDAMVVLTHLGTSAP
jgi:hypothetical protein